MHKIFAVVFATKRLQNTGFLMYSAMCPCARTLPTVRVQALKHDVSLSRHAEAGAQAGATARLATQAAAAVHNPERGRSALALLAQMTAVPNWLCRPGLQRQSPLARSAKYGTLCGCCNGMQSPGKAAGLPKRQPGQCSKRVLQAVHMQQSLREACALRCALPDV